VAHIAHTLRMAARRFLPVSVRRRLQLMSRWPPIGGVDFSDLRRLTPISRDDGYDRGAPIDRYYIEGFLEQHSQDIRGHVLEIAENTYTRRFGGSRVTQSDVLHAAPGNPNATIVADLAKADQISSNTFDCIICTQTLQVIPDVEAAVRTLHRILRPGGILLATFSGIGKIYRDRQHPWGDHWRLTTLSARWLFAKVFPIDCLEVTANGNVLVAVASLHGLAVEELSRTELDFVDPDYELLVTVRAAKPNIES